MSYFTTHLSFSLLVKEFFKLLNICKVTGKMVDCFMRHIRLTLLPSKMQNLPDTVTNHCCDNRQINVSLLLSTNIKLLQTSFDLLTDRLAPSVTDC